MVSTNPRRQFPPPLSEPVDVLLADVAIRVQLNRTDYRKAEDRYQTLAEWIDRKDSPLTGLVELVYPQGSIATGTTIASRLTTDEHDVDFIAQLGLPLRTPPKIVLDLLYTSIRGERGSMYYDMTERRNRCVTVHYADKMHADITPVIRLVGRPERESHLFHNKPEAPPEPDQTLIANPYGFAEWFKSTTPIEHEFAEAFAKRSGEYERLVILAEAQSEELPDQEPVHLKSRAAIALQLMKRWRNVRYDNRKTRRPPSVMMAKLVADAANQTSTLSEELLHQARAMREELGRWHRAGLLVRIANPVCPDDVLTDRWPESLHTQAAFISDLDDLIIKVERLIGGCSLEAMRKIMMDLFGEAPTGDAFKEFVRRTGAAIEGGRGHYTPGSGRLSLPASGIVSGVQAPSIARPAPKNTFFGMERRKR